MSFEEFAVKYPFLGDHLFSLLIFVIYLYYSLKHNILLKIGFVKTVTNIIIELSFYFILFVILLVLIKFILPVYKASIIASLLILGIARLQHMGRPIKFWD
jgi:hypothetical protein